MTTPLERLAQRPKNTATMWFSYGKSREVSDMHAERDQIEFDRDLALDALAELLSAPMTHQREKWPEVIQARAILAALKGETK